MGGYRRGHFFLEMYSYKVFFPGWKNVTRFWQGVKSGVIEVKPVCWLLRCCIKDASLSYSQQIEEVNIVGLLCLKWNLNMTSWHIQL